MTDTPLRILRGRWLGVVPKAHLLRGSEVVATRLGWTPRHAAVRIAVLDPDQFNDQQTESDDETSPNYRGRDGWRTDRD